MLTEKIIVSVTAVIIILILLLASYLWYKYYIPAAQEDILYVMRMHHSRLVIGIADIVFFSIMDIIIIIFVDTQILITFAVFYFFTLLGVYLCITVLLWRGMIKADSITFYIPLLPAKEIKFCEIDFVHYTDNNTIGLSGQKALVGYRGKKSYFPSKKIFQGFYSCVHCFTGGKKMNIFNG